MSTRFSLRFVSGDRAGEVYGLNGPRVTVGRKPGNSLQIIDGSVSGTHAELLIDEGGVVLRDRNSTNGTKVSGVAIEERELGHGDELSLGNVKLVLLDAQFAEEVLEDGSDAIGFVDPAALEGTGSRSRAGLLVAIAVVFLLVGGAYYGLGMVGSPGGGSVQPVEFVAGDLLDGGGSFEEGLGDFTNDEGASVEFLITAAWAATGRSGLQAVLVSGERARLLSRPVAARAGVRFEARASFSADAAAGARLGLLFSSGDGALSSTAWGAALVGEDEALLGAITPPGHDRVQLVLDARATGSGSVSVDDANLLRAGSSAEVEERAGFGFHLLGEPAQVLCITKISTVFVSGLEVAGASLRASFTQTGMELAASSLGTLGLDVANALVERGIASIGEGGYRIHGADFDRDSVTSVLLGKGNDLVAVHMDQPCRVRARVRGEGMRLEIALADADFRVQVDFTDERRQAGDLAYAARGAERDGQLGDCLAAWAELLERYPYQEALVVEAEGVRGRLVQEGLLALQGVRAEIERASFFQLVELYRSCRDRAHAVGARYAGSEVESEARALVEVVEVELGMLEVALDADEVSRLRSIHAVLRASESPRLADEVADYLMSEFRVTTGSEGE